MDCAVLGLAVCHVQKENDWQVRDKGVPSSYHHGKAVSSLVDDCQTMHPPPAEWELEKLQKATIEVLHLFRCSTHTHHLHYISIHQQHHIINTTSSTHHHLQNTIYTTPSTQHHPHNTIYTDTTSSNIGRCSTWSTAILPLLPHSCWFPFFLRCGLFFVLFRWPFPQLDVRRHC